MSTLAEVTLVDVRDLFRESPHGKPISKGVYGTNVQTSTNITFRHRAEAKRRDSEHRADVLHTTSRNSRNHLNEGGKRTRVRSLSKVVFGERLFRGCNIQSLWRDLTYRVGRPFLGVSFRAVLHGCLMDILTPYRPQGIRESGQNKQLTRHNLSMSELSHVIAGSYMRSGVNTIYVIRH